MTFMEKLVEKGKEYGYRSATQLFSAAGVNSNARMVCSKKGTLSDTNKQRLARVLKCSIGDINTLMAEALREQNEAAKALNKTPEVAIDKDIPFRIREEPVISPVAEAAPVSEPEPEQEAVAEPKAEIVADVNPETETEPEPETVQESPASSEPAESYHDALQARAENELQKEYAAMLRAKMLEFATDELKTVCEEYIKTDHINYVVAMAEIGNEIINLKEAK